jgi:hypothetical protein
MVRLTESISIGNTLIDIKNKGAEVFSALIRIPKYS